MIEFEEEFFRNFHMNVDEFKILYDRLKHRLEPQNTRPDIISGKQRLAITLEYLAGGAAFERYSASVYRISRSSTSNIIFKLEYATLLGLNRWKTHSHKKTSQCWLHILQL